MKHLKTYESHKDNLKINLSWLQFFQNILPNFHDYNFLYELIDDKFRLSTSSSQSNQVKEIKIFFEDFGVEAKIDDYYYTGYYDMSVDIDVEDLTFQRYVIENYPNKLNPIINYLDEGLKKEYDHLITGSELGLI